MTSSALRARLESKFLMITGVLVTLIGAPAFLSLLKEPVKVEIVAINRSRAPASFKNENSTASPFSGAQQSPSQTSLLKYDCKNKDVTPTIDSNFIRFAGMPCAGTKDIEITNTTNGFSASVIFTKDKKFSTDYIELSDGENNLEITSTLSDGTKNLKTLKILRRIPASIQNP